MDASSASKETISENQDPEESGWTSYFDDFLSYQKQGQYSDNNNILVSDAASFMADHEKISKTGHLVPSTFIMTKLTKKLDMKKMLVNKETLYDDSLDDTASSPVNSPGIVQEEEAIPYLPLDRGSEKRPVELLCKGRNMIVQT